MVDAARDSTSISAVVVAGRSVLTLLVVWASLVAQSNSAPHGLGPGLMCGRQLSDGDVLLGQDSVDIPQQSDDALVLLDDLRLLLRVLIGGTDQTLHHSQHFAQSVVDELRSVRRALLDVVQQFVHAPSQDRFDIVHRLTHIVQRLIKN